MVSAGTSAAGASSAGRTFVILNPAAGQDSPARLQRRVANAFARRGAACELVQTAGPGHATELARAAARAGYATVCVVGGDGTLAEVLTGVAGFDVPVAIIGRGTGNQVARNLGIPLRLEQAVDVALHGKVIAIDVGRLNGRVFAIMASAGSDAAMIADATRALKKRWGFGAYLFAIARQLVTAAPADFRVTTDNVQHSFRAVTVSVLNFGNLFFPFFPRGFALAPDPARSWRDGLLDVLIVAPRRRLDYTTLVWRAMRRRFSVDDRLCHLQARVVEVQSEPPMPLQVDGDLAGTTPFTARIVPAGARLRVPRA